MKFENSIWEQSDFIFKKNTLIKLSNSGKRKIMESPVLVLPRYAGKNKPVKIIQKKAFSNLGIREIDFSNCVELEEIENYAFSNNDLKIVDLTRCLNLEKIGLKAFAYNNISIFECQDTNILKQIPTNENTIKAFNIFS